MSKVCKITKISETISKYSLKSKKSLGQNFILDLNLTDKIVQTMGEISAHNILEIGPGPGALTQSLLKFGARRVIAIEKDPQFLAPLEELCKAFPGRLNIINRDILSIDPEKFIDPPVKIVSNLPYNIGTQILLNLITVKSWPPFWDNLTFMFQKEVAERLVSRHKTKSYGRLSIVSQWRSTVKVLFEVNASSFTPVPSIDSSVVQFTPLPQPSFNAPKDTLEQIVKLSFGQRRKMLRKSLKVLDKNIESILTTSKINPSLRPEELSIEQFCRLANALAPVNEKK